MKNGDYPIIKYKILNKMYLCVKNGTGFTKDDLSPKTLGINEMFWKYIIQGMVDDGLLECAEKIVPHPDFINRFVLKQKGIDYLFSEPLMEKARQFLGEE